MTSNDPITFKIVAKKEKDHIDGMKLCLHMIEELRAKYRALGFGNNDLPIERVLNNVENEIGVRAYREWRKK